MLCRSGLYHSAKKPIARLVFFKYRGYPEAAGPTDGFQAIVTIASAHFMDQGDQPHGAGGANGMPQRNTGAVDIDFSVTFFSR